MSGSLIVAVTSIKLTEMQQTIAKKYPHNDANNAKRTITQKTVKNTSGVLADQNT